ncbi:MAG: hypothetical protein ACFHVJ_09260 [Aestuariibacter sp.]
MKTLKPLSFDMVHHSVKPTYGAEMSIDYQNLSIIPSVTPACQAAMVTVLGACGATFVLTALTAPFHPAVGAIATGSLGAACQRAVLAATHACP